MSTQQTTPTPVTNSDKTSGDSTRDRSKSLVEAIAGLSAEEMRVVDVTGGRTSSTFVKELVQNQVGAERSAWMWKKFAMALTVFAIVLVAAVFGVTFWAIKLEKEVYVREGALTDGRDNTIKTSSADFTISESGVLQTVKPTSGRRLAESTTVKMTEKVVAYDIVVSSWSGGSADDDVFEFEASCDATTAVTEFAGAGSARVMLHLHSGTEEGAGGYKGTVRGNLNSWDEDSKQLTGEVSLNGCQIEGYISLSDCFEAGAEDSVAKGQFRGSESSQCATVLHERLLAANSATHNKRQAYNPSGQGSCFPASSTVETLDGPRTMGELGPDDRLQTSKDFHKVEHERWLWDVHGSMGVTQAAVETLFVAITHGSSEQPLKITAEHLMFIKKEGAHAAHMLPAGDAAVGDSVFVRNPQKMDQLIPSSVMSIEMVTELGVYAPFTWSGRLIVDGTLVSNHALFSTTLQDTYARHASLPWERMMNALNVFRFVYGLRLDAVLPECPEWLCSHGKETSASLMVQLVWRLADIFIVQPTGFFVDATGSLFSEWTYPFYAKAAWFVLGCCVYEHFAKMSKGFADQADSCMIK